MNPSELIAEATASGVVLWRDGGKLRYRGRLSAELRTRLKEHREAVLAVVSERQSEARATTRRTSRPEKPTYPCIHRGERTGERATCAEGCAAGTSLPVLSCAVHGKCVVAKTTKEGIPCCRDCTPELGREEQAPASKQLPYTGVSHLLYHLLPVAENGVWQWNVDQLKARWVTFTGRKIVAVLTGSMPFSRGRDQGGDRKAEWTLDTYETVRAYLPDDCEILLVPNDPRLREVASWVPLWSSLLETAVDGDRVFYSHAKGVTRQTETVRKWTDAMYRISLDHPEKLTHVLSRHPIAGSFRRVGKAFDGSASIWHYSGSFFWANVADFRQRPWRDIEPHWWGNEAWSGTAYSLAESGLLFKSAPNAELDPFDEVTWKRLDAEIAEWEKS